MYAFKFNGRILRCGYKCSKYFPSDRGGVVVGEGGGGGGIRGLQPLQGRGGQSAPGGACETGRGTF